MLELEEFKRKIEIAEDIHSIVKIMKTIASVNIRQYTRAVEALADYARTIDLGLQAAVRGEVEALWNIQRGKGRLCAVVFGSDQGLCGRFNDQISSHYLAEIEKLEPDRQERVIIAAGARIAPALEEAGEGIQALFDMPGAIPAVTSIVYKVLFAIESLEKKGLDRVFLFYNKLSHGVVYNPVSVKLLPVDREWLHEIEGRKWPTHSIPFFRIEKRKLFSSLIRRYLFIALYQAFSESLASENAARLSSMQMAEKNIEAKLDELNARYRQLRQDSITEELLDITGGFEILSGLTT